MTVCPPNLSDTTGPSAYSNLSKVGGFDSTQLTLFGPLLELKMYVRWRKLVEVSNNWQGGRPYKSHK